MYACSRSISISRFSIRRFLRRRATFLREMGIDLKNAVAKLQLATRPLPVPLRATPLSGHPSDVLLLSRPSSSPPFPSPSHSSTLHRYPWDNSWSTNRDFLFFFFDYLRNLAIFFVQVFTIWIQFRLIDYYVNFDI